MNAMRAAHGTAAVGVEEANPTLSPRLGSDTPLRRMLQNAALANLTLVAQGTVLARANVNMWGHFLGITISGTDPPYRIQGLAMEIVQSREWSFP